MNFIKTYTVIVSTEYAIPRRMIDAIKQADTTIEAIQHLRASIRESSGPPSGSPPD